MLENKGIPSLYFTQQPSGGSIYLCTQHRNWNSEVVLKVTLGFSFFILNLSVNNVK